MVLGVIIEQVSEMPYTEFIVENILTPFKMNHTNFVLTSDMQPLGAVGSHPLIRWETPLLPFLFDD